MCKKEDGSLIDDILDLLSSNEFASSFQTLSSYRKNVIAFICQARKGENEDDD